MIKRIRFHQVRIGQSFGYTTPPTGYTKTEPTPRAWPCTRCKVAELNTSDGIGPMHTCAQTLVFVEDEDEVEQGALL